MPNHILNRLEITGEKRIVEFVFHLIEGNQKNQFIDFNKIIPAPAFCFNKSAGKIHEGLAKELDVPIWTSFNREKWGTKWNAYSQKKIDTNSIEFETAWSSSLKVIQVLAIKFPMLSFRLKYADEDGGNNAGVITWNGGVKKETVPRNQSKEAYEIYFDLHPHHRANYQLSDGEYQYIDDI